MAHVGAYTTGGKLVTNEDGFSYVVEELPPGCKPLPRPDRHRGMRQLTNEELRRIAAMNPPPPVWFDEDQEIPFA
jgi:hypothetical protein